MRTDHFERESGQPPVMEDGRGLLDLHELHQPSFQLMMFALGH